MRSPPKLNRRQEAVKKFLRRELEAQFNAEVAAFVERSGTDPDEWEIWQEISQATARAKLATIEERWKAGVLTKADQKLILEKMRKRLSIRRPGHPGWKTKEEKRKRHPEYMYAADVYRVEELVWKHYQRKRGFRDIAIDVVVSYWQLNENEKDKLEKYLLQDRKDHLN
jgi:hypothetical protein